MEEDALATLTLKNVPEELIRQLKADALRNRRSLNQETLLRLEHSAVARPRSGEETVAELRRLHRRMAGRAPLTDAFLDRAKNTGRP